MVSSTAQQREVLDAISDEFLHNYGKGRTLVAVDGGDGAGTRGFADDLARRLGRGSHSVFRASMDRFHKPRAQRYARGEESAEGFYTDAFDYELFRRVLVEPFRLGGSAGFVTAAYDVKRDVAIEMQWQTAPQDATLIVDGMFLNRPELRGLWNYSIWLDREEAPLSEAEGSASKNSRAAGGQALYVAQANPRARASAIVDNSEPGHPLRIFADSC